VPESATRGAVLCREKRHPLRHPIEELRCSRTVATEGLCTFHPALASGPAAWGMRPLKCQSARETRRRPIYPPVPAALMNTFPPHDATAVPGRTPQLAMPSLVARSRREQRNFTSLLGESFDSRTRLACA